MRPGPKPKPPVARFFLLLLNGSTETDACWLWPGALNNQGYGQFNDGQRIVLAHRFVFETVEGAVNEALQLDHLCRNRSCVRPDHLEAVTPRVNTNRGESAQRTRAWRAMQVDCKRGHPLPAANADGFRVCKECRRQATASYRARRQAEGV